MSFSFEKLKILLTIFLFLLLFSDLFSLYESDLSVSESNVKIATPIEIILKVELEKNDNAIIQKINFPEKIEILRPIRFDTVSYDKYVLIRQNAVITSFDAGDYVIAPQTVLIKRNNYKDPLILTTDSIIIKVIAFEVDTNAEPKPIYDEIIIHKNQNEQYVLFYSGLIGLGLILIFIIIRRNKKAKSKPNRKSVRNFINELENLNKITADNDIKDMYFRLYSIITEYFAHKFSLDIKEIYSLGIYMRLSNDERNKNYSAEQLLSRIEKVVFSNESIDIKLFQIDLSEAIKIIKEINSMDNK